MKGKSSERDFLTKLGKEIGAGRDSMACGSAFITPLPPDTEGCAGRKSQAARNGFAGMPFLG